MDYLIIFYSVKFLYAIKLYITWAAFGLIKLNFNIILMQLALFCQLNPSEDKDRLRGCNHERNKWNNFLFSTSPGVLLCWANLHMPGGRLKQIYYRKCEIKFDRPIFEICSYNIKPFSVFSWGNPIALDEFSWIFICECKKINACLNATFIFKLRNL